MKKHKILKSCPVIGLRATEEEQKMFNVVRQNLRRTSNSDVIRVLVTDAYEKILNKNSPVDIK